MPTPKDITVLRLKHPVLTLVTKSDGEVEAFTSLNMYEARRLAMTRYECDPAMINVFDRTNTTLVLEKLCMAWKAGLGKLGIGGKTKKPLSLSLEN